MIATVEEWRTELAKLRFPPGSGLRMRYWRNYLDTRDDPRLGRGPFLRPCAREVRMMKPRERAELWERRPLTDAQFLRCGKNRWYVVEKDRGAGVGLRVY